MTTKYLRSEWILVLVSTLGVVSASLAHSDVLMVTSTNDSGPGSLRQCIDDAQPGDEIQFDPSLNGQPIVLTSGQLEIDKDLTISGRGADETILQGNPSSPWDRVVEVSSGWPGPRPSVAISGVTIEWGGRGGIFSRGHLTVHNSSFRRNGGYSILSRGGSLEVESCLVGADWGAIRAEGGSVTIKNSNLGSYSQGGLVIRGSVATVIDSTIANSPGGYDAHFNWGGVYAESSKLTIITTTISNNNWYYGSMYGAGGILARGGDLTIEDSTIVGNVGRDASGIQSVGGTVTLRNTVISNHAGYGPGCSGLVASLGHNLDTDDTCGLGQPTDLPDKDPELGPLQDNGGPTLTHRPLEGSPLIDSGSCGTLTDQRGVSRPRDGDGDGVMLCDIGAVEYVPLKFIGLGGDVIFPPDSE